MNESRSFLSTAIASALDFEVMSPEDVIRHITMDVLAHHLPVSLKERLLSAALESDVMNAMLVLDTLGVDALAEHAPAHLLWECVAAAATRSLGNSASQPSTSSAAGSAPSSLPLSPVANTKPAQVARKPNRSARASRVRAGATSRSTTLPATPPAPLPEVDDSAFDVDTRVGADPSLDVIEETSYDPSDDVTTHGHKP